MNKLSLMVSGAVLCGLLGCGPFGDAGAKANQSSSAVDEFGGSGECVPWQSTLVAGQNIAAGQVVVSNDSTQLQVKVTMTAPWLLAVVHVYAGVGPVPTNDGGNPAPGQFPYVVRFDAPFVDEAILSIPLAELAVGCDDVLNIALHAEVVEVGPEGGLIGGETAWAEGPFPFTGERWGYWFNYAICCDPPDEETGCTLTQGYWKNHSRYAERPSQQIAWPIDEDTAICGSTWYGVITDSAVQGNAWLTLAHQWIAANLNVAAGASVLVDVASALVDAQALLDDYCFAIPDDERDQALDLASALDGYNNGESGPGHCE